MSSAARFLLEFEATGDQEVVAKIREVGQAGKDTAADLQELQGIQDPFEPIAAGAESAVAPIEGVGTAATDTTGTLTELTTEGEAASTGMEDLGATTEEAATKTEGFGSSVATMTGAITAIGGAIGSTVSALFRYQDIQLKVQKAQLTSARATEMSRKAEEGLDKVLSTATGNTANIAAAREKLAVAQGKMNALMDKGVTSGAAFEAAQAEVTAAQKSLSAEFAKGGGDIAKLTDAMEKSEINSSKMVVSLNNLEKANRQAQQGILDMVFGFGSLGGSIVQILGSTGKWGKALRGIKGAMTALPFAATKGGVLGLAASIAGPLVIAIGAAIQAFQVFRAVPKLFDIITAGIEQNVKKASESLLQLLEIGKQTASLQPLGGATIVPVYDQMIKKLKEMLKEKKVEVEANDVTIESWDELKNTIARMPAEYQDILNSLMGVTAGTEEYSQVANAATVEAENTAAGIGTIAPAAQAATAAIYDETNSLANLGTVQEETAKAMEDGVITEIEFQRIRAATIKTTKDAINSGGQLTDSIKEQMGATEGMVQSAASVEQELQNMGIGMVNVATNSAQVETEISSLGGELAVLRGTAAGVEQEMNNLGTAVGDLRPAFDDAKKAANENAEANNTNAQVILGMIGSIEQEQEALSEVNLAYAESEKKLADLAAVESSAIASKQRMRTALNEELASLKEEEFSIRASAAATADAVIQAQALENAYLSGAQAINEWAAGLDDAAANQQGQIDQLKALGLTFSDLPSAMEPTIENLKLYGASLQGNAEDAKAWADAQSEAFATVQEAGNQMVSDLADALNKGGDDLSDITDKWLEDMPEQFRERLDESQIVAMEGMAELQALAKANKFELEADFKTESLDKARSDFIGNLEQMRSEAKPKFKGIYDEAIKIAEKGTADQMHRVAEILASDDPWPVMLERLKQIKLEQEGKRLGTDFTTGMVNGIQQGSGAVETELQGIQDQFITAFGKEKLAQEPIKITADVSQAAQAIGSIQNTLRTMVAAPIKITADVQQAGSAIASIVKTLSTLQAAPIKVTADVSQAHQAIAGLVTKTQSLVVTVTADVSPAHQAIAALVTMKPEPIVVTANTTQAVSSLNAASNAALTMRNNFNAASSGVKSAAAGAGAAVTSFSSKASSSFAKAGAAGTQMANKVKSASSSMKSSLSSAASSAASFASKCVSSFNKVGSSATSNASKVRNLASAISSLKSKTITITTRYVTSGRPGGLQHGGAFIADTPTTIGGTKVGEHYKPELVTVTPLTNPNNLDRTVTVNTPRTGGGGSREVVIPVTLMLDNKVLIRTVRRGLVEEVSGTM